MKIDVYSATGTKKGTAELPKMLFEAPINEGLMHQALVRQQSNRRDPISHAKNRAEVEGSTRKLYQQKGTGRARRGSLRSPLLRGGGKAFGPRSVRNYEKDMPKKMRRMALFSCLSLQAKNECIFGLEEYPKAIKTKDASALLRKLPVELGRRILIVTSEKHDELVLSVRNVPGVKTVQAAYLNPEDVLNARHIIFLVEALKKAEEVFGTKEGESIQDSPKKPKSPKQPKSQASSDSLESSDSTKVTSSQK